MGSVTGVDREPALQTTTIERLRRLEQDLFQRLGERDGWRFSKRDPELVRLWGRIKDDVARMRTLIERQPPEGGADRRLRDLLEEAPKGTRAWSVPAAREFAYSLTELLPQFGDAVYLTTLLEDEEIADRFKKAFGKDELKEARKAVAESPPALAGVRDQLIEVHRARARKRRMEHARHAMRARALHLLLAILVPVVIAAAAITAAAPGTSAWGVTAAVLLGAVGSVLSGAYKVPKLLKLRALRLFWAGISLLPVLGSAAGLVLFLFLHTHVVDLPETRHASTGTYALYGFLAGFSEPFFLGLVGRLAGAEKDDADAAKEESA